MTEQTRNMNNSEIMGPGGADTSAVLMTQQQQYDSKGNSSMEETYFSGNQANKYLIPIDYGNMWLIAPEREQTNINNKRVFRNI